MEEKVREVIISFYNKEISSQKLIAFLKSENLENDKCYREFHNLKEIEICEFCGNERKYVGFDKSLQCLKSCETNRRIFNLSKEEIVSELKTIFKDDGFSKTFGLKFKKFENILSPFYFNKKGKELKYCVINDLQEIPKCEYENCLKDAKFSTTKYKYAKGCCNSHIMHLENHIWNDESKQKMIKSIEQVHKNNPQIRIDMGKKISKIKLSLSDEEKEKINYKRTQTCKTKYDVENVSQIEQIKNKKK